MEYTKRLLVLEGLLSTLPDCQGWMIAKCRFSLGNRKMKTSDQFPLQILKKDGRLAKIHICSFAGEEKDLLDVTLINPGQRMTLGSWENMETEKEDLYSQIRKYADKSSIRNYVLEYLNAFLKKYEASKRNQEKKPVRIVKDYIREHYQENISLEEMAKLVDLNPVYLSVLFKRSTGVNFNDYLTNIRITKAKTMLKDTNESIAVIAEEVGYANAKYFSQLFSKVVGINPTVYRKLHS